MPRQIPKYPENAASPSRPGRPVLEYASIVHMLARKIHHRLPAHVDISDMFSAGMVGLLEASAKFKPSMGVKFECYAHLRIRGAILDSLRDVDWAPRALRRKGRAFGEATQALTVKLGRSPSSDEVAGALKISLISYHTVAGELNRLEITSLNSERHGDDLANQIIDIPGHPEDDPLLQCISRQRQNRLTTAMTGLAWRERLVAKLYYYDEMSMLEISRILGVVESRVSQIHASAIGHMRVALSDLSLRAGEKALRPRRSTGNKGAHPRVLKLGLALKTA